MIKEKIEEEQFEIDNNYFSKSNKENKVLPSTDKADDIYWKNYFKRLCL